MLLVGNIAVLCEVYFPRLSVDSTIQILQLLPVYDTFLNVYYYSLLGDSTTTALEITYLSDLWSILVCHTIYSYQDQTQTDLLLTYCLMLLLEDYTNYGHTYLYLLYNQDDLSITIFIFCITELTHISIFALTPMQRLEQAYIATVMVALFMEDCAIFIFSYFTNY
jgi:hypothetical protein